MRYRVRAATTVLIGPDTPVILKAGLVSATEATEAALDLLTTLGLAEPTDQEDTDAAEP